MRFYSLGTEVLLRTWQPQALHPAMGASTAVTNDGDSSSDDGQGEPDVNSIQYKPLKETAALAPPHAPLQPAAATGNDLLPAAPACTSEVSATQTLEAPPVGPAGAADMTAAGAPRQAAPPSCQLPAPMPAAQVELQWLWGGAAAEEAEAPGGTKQCQPGIEHVQVTAGRQQVSSGCNLLLHGVCLAIASAMACLVGCWGSGCMDGCVTLITAAALGS